MWQFKLRSKTFKDNSHKKKYKMWYICEDFGTMGHTTYKSAGLLTGSSKQEVREMLTMMLLDVSDGLEDAQKLLKKTHKKYSKASKASKDRNAND